MTRRVMKRRTVLFMTLFLLAMFGDVFRCTADLQGKFPDMAERKESAGSGGAGRGGGT